MMNFCSKYVICFLFVIAPFLVFANHAHAAVQITVEEANDAPGLFDLFVKPYVKSLHHSFYVNSDEFLTQTGFYRLWEQRNGYLPNGKRLIVAQVETHHSDPKLFPGKLFIAHPVGAGVVGHTNTSGRIFYGNIPYSDKYAKFNYGFAPGIPVVHSFTSNAFRSEVLKLQPKQAQLRKPGLLPGFDIHLDVINISNTFGSAFHANTVRAMDYFIDKFNVVACTSQPGNLSINASASGVLWNSIVVGKAKTDLSYTGGTEAENINGRKRPKPDIVSASHITGKGGGASSWTTPVVASGAAMLLDYAKGDSAKVRARNSVVIKAIIMAGAQKTNLATPVYNDSGILIANTWDVPYVWKNSEDKPLDVNYGVGSFSIYNSMAIMDANEQVTGTDCAVTGWAYNDVNDVDIDGYEFSVETASQEFSVVLTWNRKVTPDGDLEYSFTVADLSLSLEKMNSDGKYERVISSLDPGNNVEHIYLKNGLAPGKYRLLVSSASASKTCYGLAWRSQINKE